ncbi:MAG: NAD(P)-dependent oxidoreductase [Gluconacetobacter diazotrophicus]|nr:NAD(P)-dependent oxidoreductase [Gluconacetobacter diazotrophicus]
MADSTIGFIGYGAMAALMARHIREAGMEVIAFTPSGRSPDGTRMLPTARALAAESDVLLVSVPDDAAVEASAYGDHGFLDGARPGTLVINATSNSPELSRRLHRDGAKRELPVIDAPVSGSTPEAEKGELVVLAGGADADIERARPILDAIGKKTIHAGGPGRGSELKLVVNGIMVSSMVAIAEGVGYGLAVGLDRAMLFDALSGLAVVSPHHQRKLKAGAAGDFSPEFPARLAHKDLGLLLADAGAHGVPTVAIAAAAQAMTPVKARHPDKDYSAILAATERMATRV